MARNLKITKEARLHAKELIREKGIFAKEQVKDILRPHQLFDPSVAKEKELGELANRIIASIKDDEGIRNIYALNDKSKPGLFVNATVTDDIEALDKIDKQLSIKYNGLNRARKKLELEKHRVLGQLSLEDISNQTNMN